MKNKIALLITYFAGLLLLAACEKEAMVDAKPEPTASINAPALPPNWAAVQSGNGVVLGKRIYTRSGNTVIDYVQLIDLAAGATVKLRQGNANLATPTTPSPAYSTRMLASPTVTGWYWPTYASTKSFAMANLQFFNFNNGRLSFPLKNNGTIISCGSSNNEANAKRKLGINGSTIVVADYTNTANDYNTVAANLISPTVIVGLHPSVDLSSAALKGRTYLGYKNSMLVIYTSTKATQAQVRTIMTTEFALSDANLVMMDGSYSTQLVCRGIKYIAPAENRYIPSVIETVEF